MELYFMDDIVNLIKWSIGSTYLTAYNNFEIEPVCYMFVAKAGGGKSAVMEQFDKGGKYKSNIVFFEDDWTYIDIFHKIYPKITKEGKKVLITTDFSQMILRMGATVKRLMGVLLKITEKKGLHQVKDDTGLTRDIIPLKLAFITGITTQTLDKNIIEWYDTGWGNRMIFISWGLSGKQESIISKYKAKVYSEKTEFNPNPKDEKEIDNREELDYKPRDVTISQRLSNRLETCANRANQNIFNFYYIKNSYLQISNLIQKSEDGNIDWSKTMEIDEKLMDKYRSSFVRLFEKFVTIARGKALTENRSKVTPQDVDEVIRIMDRYCNLDFNLLEGG